MSKHLSPEIRVPIDTGNPSIQRNEDLCIRCGQCRDVCRDYAAVLTYYDLARTGDEAICIGCGQCEPHCPQSIQIPHELHRIAAYIEKLKRGTL